jgi:hypothetical protein
MLEHDSGAPKFKSHRASIVYLPACRYRTIGACVNGPRRSRQSSCLNQVATTSRTGTQFAPSPQRRSRRTRRVVPLWLAVMLLLQAGLAWAVHPAAAAAASGPGTIDPSDATPGPLFPRSRLVERRATGLWPVRSCSRRVRSTSRRDYGIRPSGPDRTGAGGPGLRRICARRLATPSRSCRLTRRLATGRSSRHRMST